MTPREIHKEALKAYSEVLASHGLKFWEKPLDFQTDKNWGKFLRGVWPRFHSVKLTRPLAHTQEVRDFMEQQEGSYSYAQNHLVWYFEDYRTAMAFKLTFA